MIGLYLHGMRAAGGRCGCIRRLFALPAGKSALKLDNLIRALECAAMILLSSSLEHESQETVASAICKYS